jgi:hypothetical protein
MRGLDAEHVSRLGSFAAQTKTADFTVDGGPDIAGFSLDVSGVGAIALAVCPTSSFVNLRRGCSSFPEAPEV